MPTFKYVAKDENAKTINGTLIAENQAIVIDELRKRKLTVISVKEGKEKAAFSIGTRRKVSTDDLVIFSRQLATMVDAGIPLMQSLDALREQVQSGEFKRVIGALRDDIEVGSSLSSAFAKHPQVFDHLYINMVKAGENSGMLNVILERIATYLEKASSLRRKVKSAMSYPIVVISMALLITTFLLMKVVPTFQGIFSTLGGQLPTPTRVLIIISHLLSKYIFYSIGLVMLISFIVSRAAMTEKGRLFFDQLKLRMPILGQLFIKISISRFSRTLATLIQSGVPILASLEIVGKTSGNKVIENAIGNVRTNVREGESIAQPLIKCGLFPPMVTRMISVGEQTGELEKMLSKIADFYDEQVETSLSSLTSLIEPLVIAFLGIVVGGIVISLFLPILTITQLIK